jgi:hypothetical protein
MHACLLQADITDPTIFAVPAVECGGVWRSQTLAVARFVAERTGYEVPVPLGTLAEKISLDIADVWTEVFAQAKAHNSGGTSGTSGGTSGTGGGEGAAGGAGGGDDGDGNGNGNGKGTATASGGIPAEWVEGRLTRWLRVRACVPPRPPL